MKLNTLFEAKTPREQLADLKQQRIDNKKERLDLYNQIEALAKVDAKAVGINTTHSDWIAKFNSAVPGAVHVYSYLKEQPIRYFYFRPSSPNLRTAEDLRKKMHGLRWDDRKLRRSVIHKKREVEASDPSKPKGFFMPTTTTAAEQQEMKEHVERLFHSVEQLQHHLYRFERSRPTGGGVEYVSVLSQHRYTKMRKLLDEVKTLLNLDWAYVPVHWRHNLLRNVYVSPSLKDKVEVLVQAYNHTLDKLDRKFKEYKYVAVKGAVSEEDEETDDELVNPSALKGELAELKKKHKELGTQVTKLANDLHDVAFKEERANGWSYLAAPSGRPHPYGFVLRITNRYAKRHEYYFTNRTTYDEAVKIAREMNKNRRMQHDTFKAYKSKKRELEGSAATAGLTVGKKPKGMALDPNMPFADLDALAKDRREHLSKVYDSVAFLHAHLGRLEDKFKDIHVIAGGSATHIDILSSAKHTALRKAIFFVDKELALSASDVIGWPVKTAYIVDTHAAEFREAAKHFEHRADQLIKAVKQYEYIRDEWFKRRVEEKRKATATP